MSKAPAKKPSAAGGRKRKKSVVEPPAVRWPTIPVDMFGCDPDVAATSKIIKEDAVELYRLDDKELEGLDFERKPRERGGYYKQYVEREVEWRAWEKHGGPIGFWHFLKRLQEEFVKSDAQQKHFDLPRSYTLRQRYDLSKPTPPVLPDRYVGTPNKLQRVKDELPAWFWIACNLELNRVLENGELPTDIGVQRSTTMNRAAYFFSKNPRYVGRPEQPLGAGTSLAIGTLRSILRCAPSVPAEQSEWGKPVQGLVFHRSGPEDRGCYQWGREYLDRVFGALSRLIQEAGIGDRGWRSARWEVYYKYAASLRTGLKCVVVCDAHRHLAVRARTYIDRLRSGQR
ncbi:hypothetical protein K466DRAFT_665252 [Polyporus arcularius HHB13444]|uniref:Uncharacterized protein n=1 Tax=Polyporus arcularius HHB13444 TaxID=1314778 RepID=A0A5C3P491_9APHY|nr:hypothetical protein K466DRAFT_665252 [Polyporus arcularius HHB13444]